MNETVSERIRERTTFFEDEGVISCKARLLDIRLDELPKVRKLEEIKDAAKKLDLLRLAGWIKGVEDPKEGWEWPQDIENLHSKIMALEGLELHNT